MPVSYTASAIDITAVDTQDPFFMQYQMQQLGEMLDNAMNHASIFTWGWFNEASCTPPVPPQQNTHCLQSTSCDLSAEVPQPPQPTPSMRPPSNLPGLDLDRCEQGPSDDKRACAAYGQNAAYARSRDPTRFGTWADDKGLKGACYEHASLIALNNYPGYGAVAREGETFYVTCCTVGGTTALATNLHRSETGMRWRMACEQV